MSSSTASSIAKTMLARPQARAARGAHRLVLAADVGHHEHVEHHDGAGVDDDLRRGDELGAQQQEERRQREQVEDQRQHGVEGVAHGGDADRARDRADPCDEEEDSSHENRGPAGGRGYSPSPRSGVRSKGSANNISLVKMRSLRL